MEAIKNGLLNLFCTLVEHWATDCLHILLKNLHITLIPRSK